MATLITELATVHEGTYVVRALVQVSGTTLATALAAHIDLEQAEERAKRRAVEALELGMTETISSNSRWQVPDSLRLNPPTAVALQEVATPETPPVLTPPALALDPLPDRVPPPSLTANLVSEGLVSEDLVSEGLVSEPAPIVADFYSHIQETRPEGEEEVLPDISSLVVPASTLLNKTPRRRAEPPKEVPPAPAPVDFSDVLAQTDVELRRLGWDARRGREYLKQTYSKRSRQELNEDELYDFLNYLKGQPSPSQSPF
jgi:hypothetical protein